MVLAGDMISVDDTDYVVQSLVVQFKLVRGRYQREHHRLDCMSASRFLLNRNLEHCFTKRGGRAIESMSAESSESAEEEGISFPQSPADSGPSDEQSSGNEQDRLDGRRSNDPANSDSPS